MADYIASDDYEVGEDIATEEQQLAEAMSKIRSLYDAGTPLFTREDIQQIDQQLDLLAQSPEGRTRGQKVLVRALDKSMVDFKIESGRVFSDDLSSTKGDYQTVLNDPLIYYTSIQELTSATHNFNLRTAYCSLRIYHFMGERHKITKEPIDIYPPRFSSEDLDDFFQSARNDWEASEPCQQLRSTLMPIGRSCNKAVGFALGSMACRYGNGRSVFQHALLLTLVDCLVGKNQSEQDIPTPVCYVQDPVYFDADEKVLEKHGIAILKDPKGFLAVDDSTVILSCAPNVPVKQIVCELAQPAVMIVNKILDGDSEEVVCDPDSPRLKKLVNDFYDCFAFPGDEEHFGDLAIYVRRPRI